LRAANDQAAKAKPAITYAINRAQLIQANCFDWLRARDARSIHAIVTDPPYGLVEYSHVEQTKLRDGCGGVWRIPPSFDGHQRAPLPRFTELDEGDLQVMHDFFFEFGQLALRVTVPGANATPCSLMSSPVRWARPGSNCAVTSSAW
jgi:site-specific DNA-methyltransferase (adenine-specific)